MDIYNLSSSIIEAAKKESEKEFCRFVTGIYGVDSSLFDHIFEIPVIGRYSADDIITDSMSISTKTNEELYEIINEAINNKKFWTNDGEIAKYVNFDEIEELIDTERDELYSLIKQNAAIVYDESLFNEAIEKNSMKLSEEEVYDKYKKIMKDTLTHERVHVNNAYMDITIENEEYINTDYVQDINGAEEGVRYDIEDMLEHDEYLDYWRENNEVIVETISLMISNYHEGDTLNECLERVLKERNEKNEDTIYPGIDDTLVLGTYILFTDELTEWMSFGAYKDKHENLLKKLMVEVCGTDLPPTDSPKLNSNPDTNNEKLKYLSKDQLKENFENYVKALGTGKLSNKQIEMLEMLGFSTKQIDKTDLKIAATSEEALKAIEGQNLNFFEDKQNENDITK